MLTGPERAAFVRQLSLTDASESVHTLGERPDYYASLLGDDVSTDEGAAVIIESIETSPRSGSNGQESITVAPEELMRLRRLVQLVTTTVGELNLWLASAGRPLRPEDR